MFYANGKLYYTRSGQNTLYWRWFSPDSGHQPAAREHRGRRQHHLEHAPRACSSTAAPCTSSTRPTASCSRSASSTARRPARRPWPTRTIDWRGKALFLASVLPNVAAVGGLHLRLHRHLLQLRRRPARPTPTAASSPTSGRSATATRPAARTRRRTSLETGTYDVTLTVTDDGGLTSIGDPAGLGREAERRRRPRPSPPTATTSTATSTPPRRPTATAPSTTTRGTSETARPAPGSTTEPRLRRARARTRSP